MIYQGSVWSFNIHLEGRKDVGGSSTNVPSNIKPMQHVKEHPDDLFIVSNSRLFCTGCCEELCIKKIIVKIIIIASAKYKKGTERLREKTAKEKNIIII